MQSKSASSETLAEDLKSAAQCLCSITPSQWLDGMCDALPESLLGSEFVALYGDHGDAATASLVDPATRCAASVAVFLKVSLGAVSSLRGGIQITNSQISPECHT